MLRYREAGVANGTLPMEDRTARPYLQLAQNQGPRKQLAVTQ